MLAVTALWAAPKALSIFVNDTPFAGKALWYKDRIYVSLEDLAGTLNATYSFKPSTGEVRLQFPNRGVGAPSAAMSGAIAGAGAAHPYVKVAWEQKYFYPNNVKIVSQFQNVGDAKAVNVEVICIFKDSMLKPITADVRYLGDMEPGDSRTTDFYLYPSGGYGSAVAQNSANYYGYAGFGIVDDDKISIKGELSNVYHQFRLNYPGAPNAQGR